MRFILFIFALSLFTALNTKAQSNAQLKNRHVTQLVTQSVELKNGKLITSAELSIYDRKGNLIVEKRFDQDSICIFWKEYTYGKKGVLLEERQLNSTGTVVISRKTHEYNKFYDEVRLTTFNDKNQVEEISETQYDADRRKKQVVKLNSNKELISTTSYTYDSRGMLVLRVTLDSKGEIISSKSNQYLYAN
jgi:hypothetical protein